MRRLDINKLLEVAEDLIHDGRIEMADRCHLPVQIVEDSNGKNYHLLIVAVRDLDGFENTFLNQP